MRCYELGQLYYLHMEMVTHGILMLGMYDFTGYVCFYGVYAMFL